MSLSEDLKSEVTNIFKSQWEVKDAQVVPTPDDLKLANDARYFDRATILYADLSGSTKMVDSVSWEISGEIYKTYLACAARIVRSEQGEIVAYDGDRIMSVFIGELQTNRAAKCGLKINWAVKNIVNTCFKKQYPSSAFDVKHVVGIDTSKIRAARIGIRGGNDLVWIGSAANYAAKLTECSSDYPTWMTERAFKKLNDTSKFSAQQPRQPMWKKFTWTAMNDVPVYGSRWLWRA